MQRRRQLSDLVALQRAGRFDGGRWCNGLLSVLTSLFEQCCDAGLRSGQIMVGAGDLVAQLRQLVLQVDIGGFDAARLNLGVVRGARVPNIAHGGEANRDDGNPGRYRGHGMDTAFADQCKGTASISNGMSRGESPRSPVQQTAGHSPPRPNGLLPTSNATTLPVTLPAYAPSAALSLGARFRYCNSKSHGGRQAPILYPAKKRHRQTSGQSFNSGRDNTE